MAKPNESGADVQFGLAFYAHDTRSKKTYVGGGNIFDSRPFGFQNGVVSRHDIAGIWVAFFSRCQRYRCRQEAPPPTDETYVAVLLETLISINGTKAEPVKGVTVQGITFRDAADITMNPWGVPSGGDWGLYRGGAIFVEGAEDITIQHNTLTRLDGNGVFVSGYTRNVNITDSEFSWVPTTLSIRNRLPSTS